MRSLAALGVLLLSTSAAAQTRSTSAQREEVSITVYNQSFGLVREVRNVDLPLGRTSLEFRDVSQQIQPETVAIKAAGLRVLEQNYRYDLLSPDKLLEKYVGKKVKVVRWNDKTGHDEETDAEVLSTTGGTVLKIGGEITYGFPGRISFPSVPDNLIARPTLVWMLDNQAPKQKVEVTYLTNGMSWSADYVFVIDEADTAGDLNGWVTLNNQTGTSYENAKLKLVAGDVQRIQDQSGMLAAVAGEATLAEKAPAFREEGFFEYHLYTLDRPTTLLTSEQKQVSLLEARGVKVDKRLVFFGAAQYYRSRSGEVASNQKVGVYLDIDNRESNHLGMPLPKGTVRVYKADKAGQKQFIGEDAIDHTPRDEKVRIKMGEAFDVVGDRKQTEWRTLGVCASESAWEITLKNHKDTAVDVEVVEPIGGDWEILKESLPHVKKDSTTFTFRPHVEARKDVKITYRVRIRWC